MKVDANLLLDLTDVASRVNEVEAAGYSGVWTAEMAHDPFLPLLLAAQNTTTMDIGTSIAVAFARSPMTVANTAWDLQAYSQGRFVLGLGSQIRPHITKRFSMEWSHPVPRMREFILAVRAIWEAWLTGEKLDFRGDFYTHTVMTPYFTPDKADLGEFGPPRVFLAGVGEKMTEAAGEVADGFISHGFTTERYLREVTIPALERGRAKAGKTMEGFEIGGPMFVVSGGDADQIARSAESARQTIAFYASTPSYTKVLELHGWADIHEELNSMSKRGQWAEMGTLIDDEMLNTFAVVGEPDEVASELSGRYGDIVDRLSFYAPDASDLDRWSGVVSELT
ncbi:MAG: LLM class F420-dependent oxidoreductase [Actinomycetota bacterium]|jgi:probable F420-dependent oxidoreductase|nr:LLM class F420-dependent oxidoreductase [Actinomycetota bacterium]